MPTVLIVDDDKFTRTVLETAFAENQAFANLEIATRTADDGAQGLTEFLKHRPDVVITDLLMPNVDGWELCRAIRSEPAGQHVHLIAISGVSRDAAIGKKLGDELDAAFFAKPYQMREMIEHIAQLLNMDARGEDSRQVAIPQSPQTLQASSGDLSKRPLPAVLLDFLEAQATGHLTIKRGRIIKVIELVVGHPYSVSSTARDETLGHFLTAFGVITADQHRRAVRRAAAKKERVSTALIGLGFVSPEDMVTRLTMHICYRLIQSLRWPDGSWQFQPQDSPAGSPRGNPIDMAALILQGMRHSASMDNLPERITQIEKRPLTLNPRGKSLRLAVRQYLNPVLAEVWRDGITAAELLSAGVDPNGLYVTLDALLCCQAIDVGVAKTDIVYDSAAEATLASMTGAAFGQSGSRETGDFSIEELSRAVHNRQAERSEAGDQLPTQLYDTLFADMSSTMVQGAGELPIELPDEEIQRFDSGIIDVSEISSELRSASSEADNKYARRLLLKEYLRVQGTDHYTVLGVDMKAAPEQLSAALAERKSKFSLEWFARYDLGRDYAKVEEIHATYDLAFQVLADDDKRNVYDRALTGDDGEHNEPGMAAEMAFHAGWDLLEHGSYRGAIAQLEAATYAAPDEADYHAALGWAHYLEGDRTAHAADQARPHLNQGLVINPDHAASHEYKGIIDAEVGTDEAEAIFHLERAVDNDPTRSDAFDKLKELWARRGEWRSLERQYRKSIYRVGGSNNPELELALWLELADLCKNQLGQPDDARIAYHSAARLAPEDPRVRDGLQGGGGGDADSFADGARFLRQRWRREPTSAQPGIELMRLALEADRPDPAFMAASALMARDQADDDARALFERYRPRFVLRAQRTLASALWALLRHPLDSPELGALFECLAPVIETSFPMRLDDLEVDDSMEITDDDLPEPFSRVRAYVAHLLGVSPPQVYLRSDFGHQVHVGAVSPPVLLAGEEILTSTERLELAFRLGRAMTFLSPGRTFAGSRPARMLKGAVLAVFAIMQPGAPIPDPEGYVAAVTPNLATLPPKSLTRVKGLVGQLTQRSHSLNLSQWSRALGRTADRMGLILCGDLPASVRFAQDSGSNDAIADLIDYAVGGNCWKLRDELGLSIAV